MYGHGISSCNHFTVCALCCGSHLSNVCNTFNDQTNQPVYKCFNFASNDLPHNHKVTDPSCLFRAKYISTMSSARDKSKRIPKKITSNNNTLTTKRHTDAPAPPPLTESFAYIAGARANKQPNTSTSTNSANSFASSSSTSFAPNTDSSAHTNTNSSNLFTFAQLTQLLLSSINELKQRKTKLDQIQVIANLLQYACD